MPQLNLITFEIFCTQTIGLAKEVIVRWHVLASTDEGETFHLCPNTQDPDLVNGLFYWHGDPSRMASLITKEQAVFSLWRTLIREGFFNAKPTA